MKKVFFAAVKKILPFLLLAVFILGILPIRSKVFANIIFLPLEKKFGKEIEFSQSLIWLPGKISLADCLIRDKQGRLYYCKSVDLRYNLAKLLIRKIELTFSLSEIKLYQDIGLLNSVADLLTMSKMPDVEFDEMKGVLVLFRDATLVKDVDARNDRMRISGGGWIDHSGLLDCDVRFSFSRELTDMIPEVVKIALLKKEDDGWMGISFKVKGNYKRPSLHITGDTLKMNIMEAIKGLDEL